MLKLSIADREGLVDNEDIWIYVNRCSKCNANEHTRRVDLHGLIKEFANIRKRDNIGHPVQHFLARYPHDSAVQKYILPTREFRVEASAQFQ